MNLVFFSAVDLPADPIGLDVGHTSSQPYELMAISHALKRPTQPLQSNRSGTWVP